MQGVVLTPLDFAETSGAYDALQEIQSAGGLFGQQLGQQAPSTGHTDSIEEEKKESKSETIDVKAENDEDAEIEKQMKEKGTAVERDIIETKREEDVPPEIKQEVEVEERKLEMKDEVSDETVTDRKEAEVMDRQPDGEESEEGIKAIKEEPQKQQIVESETHKVEMEIRKGDEAEEKDDEEGRGEEQTDSGQIDEDETRKEEKEEKREEETSVGAEVSEVKTQGSDIQGKKTDVEREKKDSDSGVTNEAVRDTEMKPAAQAEEIEAADVQETEVPVLEVETRLETAHDQSREGHEDKTADKITADSLTAQTATQPSDHIDTLIDDQRQPAGSEAVELPSHQAAPPPTPPTPTKKRRRWLFKSPRTDDQEQQQTESSEPKHRFSLQGSREAESPSTRTDNLEKSVSFACAYGALVSGAIGGVAPQQHIVKQLQPVLPQLQNVPNEMVDEQPVESRGIKPVGTERAEAEMEGEIVTGQADASKPTQSSTEEGRVEESLVVATGSTAIHVDVPPTKAVESEAVTELVKEDQPLDSDENFPVPGNPPAGRKPELPVTDAKEEVVLEIPAGDSGLKQAMALPTIDLSSGDKKQPAVVEELEAEKRPPATEQRGDVATQSQPIVLETRQRPDMTSTPIQSMVVETDRKPVSVSHQRIPESPPPHLPSPPTSPPVTVTSHLTHRIGEKSIGSLTNVATIKTDQAVANIQDTGGQVEAEPEHKLEAAQQMPDLLSDGEKKLIESLRVERERPSSAAANAMRELARVRLSACAECISTVQLSYKNNPSTNCLQH